MRRKALLIRELRLRARQGGWAVSCGVFLATGLMAPLALGGEPALLREAAPGALWLLLGLSMFLGLEGLFEDDLRGGVFERLILSPLALSEVMLIKLGAAWAFLAGPLLVAVPVLLLAYGAAPIGALAFLLASPGLVLTSGVVSALASGQRRGGPLLVFCALPLIVPALVFGPQAGEAGLLPFLILAAHSLVAVAVCPFLAAAAIRLQLT
ncbi:heme exporter protein CcmB [Parvularcula maris]|uniref:Heme exporter protein B n=1 Tax=Parvularcula maris TaxID=2965077 RepID=A0A9X2L9V0_9PROT|nr:heme exporter protein CcmB [Parvularcula maris]MCQ8185783.1 heme exporter protein CcmB [Parvularcula maris]